MVGRDKSVQNRIDVPSALLRTQVADPHVHCGLNPFGFGLGSPLRSDFGVYKEKMAGLNVTRAVLIPEPTYEVELSDGAIERSCVWNINSDGSITYKRITTRNGKQQEDINPNNPYMTGNLEILKTAISSNKICDGRKFYFAPLFHPKLDTEDGFLRFADSSLTVAIKIHGISTYCGPGDMPKWIINLAKKKDLPFIIHTDYIRSDKAADEFANLVRRNSALKWAKWAIRNGVRAYLAHGIALDPEAAHLVGSTDQLVVGTGPDFLINKQKERLAIETEFLPGLLNMIPHKQIVFSTDYAWNVLDPSIPTVLDWQSKVRIIDACISAGLDVNTIKRILYSNAAGFFRM